MPRLIRTSLRAILPSFGRLPGPRMPAERREQWFADEVLPERLDAVADELNERLAGQLPDGMRIDWAPIAKLPAD